MNTSTRIKKITTSELMQFYKPDEIFGNCKNCPRYNKNWSCPPRAFNIEEFVTIFSYTYVISIRFTLSEYSKKEEAIAAYYQYRKKTNYNLLERENENYTTLFAGHCERCAECTKVHEQECPHPEEIRYSYESLGFKVSDIVNFCFDEKLQWNNGTTTDSLLIVAGLLSDKELSTDHITAILNSSYNTVDVSCCA